MIRFGSLMVGFVFRGGWSMAEPELVNGGVKENKLWKGVFAVSGIMSTLVIYGVLQVCLVFMIPFSVKCLPFLTNFFCFVIVVL